MIRAALLAALALATPVAAQEVGDCDWRATAQAQVEPWEQNTRTFANGKTRVTLMDVVEPAAGAYYLMVLSPPTDELGSRQCRIVGYQSHMGFAGLDFAGLAAAYDPSVGLIFAVPVSILDQNSGQIVPRVLDFTVNQATGHIGVGMR